MEIKVKVKALTGDKCNVVNYKSRYNTVETGTVMDVSVGINKDGSYRVAYRVLLDRKTTGRSRMFREGGAPLFLHVGDDKITKL